MIERSDEGGIATIRMAHEPANVLATEFVDALWDALADARDDARVRGVVVTGRGPVFSAGVDLFRVIEGGDAYGRSLLDSLARLFDGLRVFPKPVVAAVNGHAIAGGAVMALACDYRIMTSEEATIGLPELRIGVPFPALALEVVCAAVPRRHRREVLLLGRTFEPAAAFERGLVDEVVPRDDVLPRAGAVARELGAIAPAAFALTKRQLAQRPGGDPDGMDAALDEEVRAIWSSPEAHERIQGYLERTLGRSSRSGTRSPPH